ncbi:hypothetical protein BKA82DRAFT_4020163 [Pisolithus tinctorius]|nr:hypothetical protein BKA82DRAFT_4020163 [Pisolithus tinctorius]
MQLSLQCHLALLSWITWTACWRMWVHNCLPIMMYCLQHLLNLGKVSYLQQWLPHQWHYLAILLDMEAPPEPRDCVLCGVDGIFQCTECAHWLVFCTMCCWAEHKHWPFHRVEQWNGTFFEESSLQLASLVLHVGHGGKHCPASGCSNDEVTTEEEDDSHIQLMQAGMFPATTKATRTAFTFQVLDDFVQDNVECGTSVMNFYSKLCCITSNAFPHLVPDRYRELLRVARMWWLLKLLKWQGSHMSTEDAGPRELVLFCPACPQPSINILEDAMYYSHWTLARCLVMDGNFKAEHMHPKDAGSEAWLMDGKGYMVTSQPYKEYLSSTKNVVELIKQMPTGSSLHLNRWMCLQVNMDYALVHAIRHGTVPGQQVIHFYDINCQYSKEAWLLPIGRSQSWGEEAAVALDNRLSRLQAMDIYEVRLQKGLVLSGIEAPSAKAIEIDLLAIPQPGHSQGMVTWIAKALKIEEAQIQLAVACWHITSRAMEAQNLTIACHHDHLQSHIHGIFDTAKKLFGDRFKDAELCQSSHPHDPETIALLLPSNLQLQQGQANDCLHELQLVLAEKAVIFQTDICHGSNYHMAMHAWGRVTNAEAAMQCHAAVYHWCRIQLGRLGARPDILEQYKELNDSNLTIGVAVSDPNARGHRDDTLPWIWTMDVPRDMATNDWMSEFYRVNWLWMRVLQDRWKEEVQLLKCEQEWTKDFFENKLNVSTALMADACHHAKLWESWPMLIYYDISSFMLYMGMRFCCLVAAMKKLDWSEYRHTSWYQHFLAEVGTMEWLMGMASCHPITLTMPLTADRLLMIKECCVKLATTMAHAWWQNDSSTVELGYERRPLRDIIGEAAEFFTGVLVAWVELVLKVQE